MPTSNPSYPKTRRSRRQFWLDHIEQQQTSGLSQRAYCQSHELGYGSFVRWRGLVLKEQQQITTDAEPAFIPVHIVHNETAHTQPSGADAHEPPLRLILPNGACIESIHSHNLSLAVQLASQL